jgi:hypothetical protein
MNWLPEQLCWSGLEETPSGPRENHGGAHQGVDCEPPFSEPPLEDTEVCLQVADEQRRLMDRSYSEFIEGSVWAVISSQ